MAKKAARRSASKRAGRKGHAKGRATKRSAKKVAARRGAARPASSRRTASAKPVSRKKAAIGARRRAKPLGPRPAKAPGARAKAPRLNRARRQLEEVEALVQTPPSSLDMDRHASAARTGRAELEESLQEHGDITPALTGGDVDANWENAYFSGDEAPGGDNPTPDQDIVDNIGKALGVEYQDNEELKPTDKVAERDRHRWELDPASAEDYKDRK